MGGSPAAAVLAALSANPGGAAVAVIAGHVGISTAAAWQALLAHEKVGTGTRVRGGRPGIADTWKPAAPSPDPGDEAPGAGGTDGAGQPAAAPADSWQSGRRRQRAGILKSGRSKARKAGPGA